MRYIRKEGDKLVLSRVIAITCGCGSVNPDMRHKLVMADAQHVPVVTTNSDELMRAYIKQEGLDEAIPSLKRSKHAAIYNPFTKEYIDLLNVPNSQQVYDNIRLVVNG